MADDNDWFAPKRLGYGAGLPIAWQGWALLGGYVVLVMLAAVLMAPHHPMLFGILLLAITVPLVAISAQHTRGGWKWRWVKLNNAGAQPSA